LALPETEASIVSLMRENPKISMREIAEKIGVTQRTVDRKVEGLKKKKVLEMICTSLVSN
jgi:DNA-binding Lrp family transcriptional regulator